MGISRIRAGNVPGAYPALIIDSSASVAYQCAYLAGGREQLRIAAWSNGFVQVLTFTVPAVYLPEWEQNSRTKLSSLWHELPSAIKGSAQLDGRAVSLNLQHAEVNVRWMAQVRASIVNRVYSLRQHFY